MKQFKRIILFILIFTPVFLLCACTTNNTENLAKDLDSTVKNLIIEVSTLDWPADGDLDGFNSIEHISNTSQTQDASVVVDTQIDTTEIYTWLEHTHSKINVLFSKRGDLLLYLNEMYGGNTNLTEDDLLAINVYMNILKDNSNYLNSYNGMLKNQINEAKEIYTENNNVNLINAYLIKAVETLQLRCAKIDTSILAMTSIIDIIKNNLINNYFDYNEHNISTENNDITSNNSNANQTESSEDNSADNVEQLSEGNETITNDGTGSEEQNSIDTPDDENAINFESETTEVELQEEVEPIPADLPNYDNLIKTLEEPIIDDAEAFDKEEQPKTEELNTNNQSTDKLEQNAETSAKDIKEIDADFAQEPEENIAKTETLDEKNTDDKLENTAALVAENQEINYELQNTQNNNDENTTVTREIIKENIV